MNWFKNKKEINNEEDYELIRILEIKRRISDLRSSFGWTKESNQDTSIQSEPVVVSEKQLSDSDDKRNRELDDLKRKLLGGKK